jgi:hypothetical protein
MSARTALRWVLLVPVLLMGNLFLTLTHVLHHTCININASTTENVETSIQGPNFKTGTSQTLTRCQFKKRETNQMVPVITYDHSCSLRRARV